MNTIIVTLLACSLNIHDSTPVSRACLNFNAFCTCQRYHNGCWTCPASCESATQSIQPTTQSSQSSTQKVQPNTQTSQPTKQSTQSTTQAITPPSQSSQSPTTATISPSHGNYCLQCEETVSPHTCSHVTKCGNTESCFIDSFVNSIGGIRYRLGCRDTHQCSISGKRELSSNTVNRHLHSAQDMHHRRGTSDLYDDTVVDDSRTSVVCSQCCNGSLCNTGGCGANPYPDLKLGTRGPMCFTCSQQSSTDDCDTVRLCGRNEMCKLEQISISDIVLWTTSCEDARTCHMLMNSAGSNCTSTCCASDLCNHECPAVSVTTTPKPPGCPQIQCLLDCGDPPKFIKDIQGCDLCQCDFGR